MTTKNENHEFNKRPLIVGLIVAVLLVLFWVVGLFQASPTQNEASNAPSLTNATIATEKANAELLKSTLNLYYVQWGYYPTSLDRLYEMDQMDDKSDEQLKSAIDDLGDFEYQVRGDGDAYKFTYIDSAGQEQTVEGNYQNEYH